jgi:fumarate reductase subunit D
MSKTNEPFWWSLFSAGGVMAALFVPGFILASGFLLPTSDSTEALERFDRIHGALSWWPVRIVLFGVIFLSFFHCAHRVRHTLMDLGLRGAEKLLMAVCYTAALAGTVAAAVLLVRI